MTSRFTFTTLVNSKSPEQKIMLRGHFLIFKTMNWGWNLTTTGNKVS